MRQKGFDDEVSKFAGRFTDLREGLDKSNKI
jgi:hypothetical protein